MNVLRTFADRKYKLRAKIASRKIKNLIQEIDKRINVTPPEKFSFENVSNWVGFYTYVDPELFKQKTRRREIVTGRQICMHILVFYSSFSLKQIGQNYNRDHSTVLHSVEAVENLLFTDPLIEVMLKVY